MAIRVMDLLQRVDERVRIHGEGNGGGSSRADTQFTPS